MNCPKCGRKMRVTDTRPYGKNLRIRHYKCPNCGNKEVSEEKTV